MKTNEKKGIKIMRIIFAIIDFIKKIFERAHGTNSINNVPRGTIKKEK